MSDENAHPESSDIGYVLPLFFAIVGILIFCSLWQYRNVLMELHQLSEDDLYRHMVGAEAPEDSENVYGLRVALIRSQTTMKLSEERAAAHQATIDTWREILDRNQFPYDMLDEVPVIDKAYSYNLMVLPAVSAFSNREVRSLKEYLKTGRGLLMTWGCGTLNEHGQWNKYSVMQEIAGIEPSGLPPELEGNLSGLRMLKRQVLSGVMPSGLTVSMSRYDRPIAGRVLEERTMVDGIWTDGKHVGLSDSFNIFRERAAIAHGEYFGGRYVWMGYTVNSSVAVAEQANALQATLRESMLWAGRQIRLVKPNWPGGQPAALSITQNLRVAGGAEQELMEVAGRYKVPVTTFVGREVVEQVPEVLHRLDAAGEVGVLVSADNKSETSVGNLKKMRRKIKKVLGKAPIGCRVEGEMNSRLSLALVKAGFLYVSCTTYDRLVPQVLRSYRPVQVVTRPRYLWLMPEMPCDADGADENGGIDLMFTHVSESLALGGYCCLSFDAKSLAAGSSAPERLDRLLSLTRDEKVWTTTSRDIAQTWAWWDNIKISTKPISQTQASIQISNTGLTKAPSLDLDLYVFDSAADVQIDAMMLGVEPPSVLASDGHRWSMRFDGIRAGKNLAYKIQFKGSVL